MAKNIKFADYARIADEVHRELREIAAEYGAKAIDREIMDDIGGFEKERGIAIIGHPGAMEARIAALKEIMDHPVPLVVHTGEQEAQDQLRRAIEAAERSGIKVVAVTGHGLDFTLHTKLRPEPELPAPPIIEKTLKLDYRVDDYKYYPKKGSKYHK